MVVQVHLPRLTIGDTHEGARGMTMLPAKAVELQKEGMALTDIAVGALALAVIALAVSVGRLWRYIDVLSEIAVKQALVDAMRQARAKEREA